MSTHCTDIVWQKLDVSGPEKLLLLAIADISNHEGDNIHPSNQYLVWMTGIRLRTVQFYKAKWKEMGALVPVENEKGGAGNFVHYRLNLDVFPLKKEWLGKGARSASFWKTKSEKKDAVGASLDAKKGCSNRHEKGAGKDTKGAAIDKKGCINQQCNKEEPLDEPLDRTKSGNQQSRLSPAERDSWDLRRWREARKGLVPQSGDQYHFLSRDEKELVDLEMDRSAAYTAGITIDRLQELLRPFFPNDPYIDKLQISAPLFEKAAS